MTRTYGEQSFDEVIFRLPSIRWQKRLERSQETGSDGMTSERRRNANRRNGSSGRGPQTAAGKAISSRNALKHGLTARYALLPGEDPIRYGQLRDGLMADLKPQGALERELVERLAHLSWRLRRVPGFEAQLMAAIGEGVDLDDDSPVPAGLAERGLGHVVKGFLKSDFSSKLNKYEASLQRQFSAILWELRYMQKQRRKEAENAQAVSIEEQSPPDLGSTSDN